MKFSITDFVSKCDQIRSLLRIWLHELKKSVMKNFIFCAVIQTFFMRFLTGKSYTKELRKDSEKRDVPI